MTQPEQDFNRAADGAGARSAARPTLYETWDEQTFMVMRNDLTVIRGQAQLMQRALSGEACLDARSVRERLNAIITSVDEASLELQQLQSSARARHHRL